MYKFLIACCCFVASVELLAAPGAKPVVVASAESRLLAPVNWYTGTIISRDQARVAAGVSGRLQWVAEVGATVQQGGVVARIDDELLQQTLAERAAEAERVKAQLVFLEQEASRLQRLAKQNNAAQSQLEKTDSELAAAQGELGAAEARKRRARAELERSRLRAPFAGVVTERLLQAGEWADDGAAVISMTDTERLEAQSWVSVSALPFVSTGSVIDLSIGDMKYKGKVRTLVPVSDLRSRLYELRIELPAGQWNVGQSVRIAVPTAAAREVLAVPRDALVLRRGSISVFKLDAEGIARQVMVTTGTASGPYIEVSGDLQAGDRVVIRGSERLSDGQPVTVQSLENTR